ncbi:MAG: hypothetical protein LIO99_12105 [Clostridiales bacterium]|nr:hypothetical protein [Clostridiales bacterium]
MKRKRGFFLGTLALPFTNDKVPSEAMDVQNNDIVESTTEDKIKASYSYADAEADIFAATDAISVSSDSSGNNHTGQTEDAVMKSMMQFFADEMLPAFGITKKVKALAPTEQVHVEIRKGLQDFNLVMDDSSISHFEFQSTNGGKRDMRRFRSYEADASYQLGQPVTTYVLFSGNIKKPMTRITEGVNTYRIVPVIMRKKNADVILKRLHKKIAAGTALSREDLVMLPLLPVMGGHVSQKERIRSAFRITSHADNVSKEDISRIEAAIYAMATKFLDQDDLKGIREEFEMTIFSEFVEDGRKLGLTEGRKLGLTEGRKLGLIEGRNGLFQELVEKKLNKGNSISEIAAALEQDEDSVRQIASELAGGRM